jgi:hypothetical protein
MEIARWAASKKISVTCYHTSEYCAVAHYCGTFTDEKYQSCGRVIDLVKIHGLCVDCFSNLTADQKALLVD